MPGLDCILMYPIGGKRMLELLWKIIIDATVYEKEFMNSISDIEYAFIEDQNCKVVKSIQGR